MRNIVNNNYANVTCEFAYHGGTGYAVAYSGGANSEGIERLWMKPIAFEGCKSRDDAELKAIYYLINGNPQKDSYGIKDFYRGFNKNARIQLIGFDAFEKGIYSAHKANQSAWKAVLNLFGVGRNGLRFDLVSVNDSVSKAINHAETFRWKAYNRDQHAAEFAAMVKTAVKSAKTRRAAVAKTEETATAETTHAPVAEAARGMEAKAA